MKKKKKFANDEGIKGMKRQSFRHTPFERKDLDSSDSITQTCARFGRFPIRNNSVPTFFPRRRKEGKEKKEKEKEKKKRKKKNRTSVWSFKFTEGLVSWGLPGGRQNRQASPANVECFGNFGTRFQFPVAAPIQIQLVGHCGRTRQRRHHAVKTRLGGERTSSGTVPWTIRFAQSVKSWTNIGPTRPLSWLSDSFSMSNQDFVIVEPC